MSDEREILSRMGRYWVLPRDVVEYLIEQWEHSGWKKFKGVPPRSDGFESHVDYMEEIGVIGQLAAESIKTRYSTESDDEDREEPRSRRTMPPPAAAPRGRGNERDSRTGYGIPVRAAPKNKGNLFSGLIDGIDDRLPPNAPDFVNGTTVLIGAIVLIVLLAIFVFAFMRGMASPASTAAVAPNSTAMPGVTPASSTTPIVPVVKLDSDWWTQIKTAPVIERSPMRLGHLDQYSMVVQILGLALIILMLADALPRRKSQRNVVLVAVLSLLAGLLTVPLLNWAAFSTATTFVMWVVLILLWSAPIYSVLMHHDNTALTVALALLALVIFDLGVFALPAGLAPIFGATWTPWQGVTGFGGWLQLIMAFRFGEVILTTILFTTMLVAIYLAANEVGKKYGGIIGGLVAGLIMLIVWWVLSWLLGKGVLWLANTQNLTATVLLVLEVLRPVLAWLLSMVVATVAGVAMGDMEVEFRQNKIKLGLGGGAGGGWAQTTADFAVLATIFALAGILIFAI